MATALTLANISDRIRRATGDYPAIDALTAQVGSGGTTVVLPFTAGTNAVIGQRVVIDAEEFLVTAVSSNSVTANRAWSGTTGATHAAGTAILIGVQNSPSVILDAMAEAVENLWPSFFNVVLDESTVTTGVLIADYALPAAFGDVGIVTDMEILLPGLSNDGWRTFRWWRHMRGSITNLSGTTGNLIHMYRIPPVGTYLRMMGIAPITSAAHNLLTSEPALDESGSLSFGGMPAAATTYQTNNLPVAAVPAIIMYAQHYLAAVQEAKRESNSTAKNIGPMSVETGKQMALSQFHYQRFQAYCATHAMRYPTWRTRRKM